ncbi:hypothetical protein SDC9_184637 [bioreactor metagenome]|uniref:Stage III sporulation protein AH n=1 Tax=bioreactor metagenome TaxID=1076179 RepID=A0A645HDM5_9ZZZZ
MKILIQIPRFISRKRVRRSIAGLLFLCILIGVGWALSHRQAPHFEEKNTMPVNGSISGSLNDSGIEVSTEIMQKELHGENYFVDYRLRRDRTRQEEKTMLTAILNSNVEKTKAEAQQKWLELTSRISKEDEIENLLRIKGFQDGVVDISPSSVNIIIFAASLSPHEISVIQDITMRVADVRIDRINISVRK